MISFLFAKLKKEKKQLVSLLFLAVVGLTNSKDALDEDRIRIREDKKVRFSAEVAVQQSLVKPAAKLWNIQP